MRPLIRYLFPLALMALAGCNKEMPDPVGHDGGIGHDGMEVQQEVVISFAVQEYDDAETKANTIGVYDSGVDRIDIFAYNDNGDAVGHSVLGGTGSALDLTTLTFRDGGGYGENRYYLIMANLDADSADYIATLSGSEVCSYPKGFIPWSAGNCRVNRPLMCATMYWTFSSSGTQTASVSLMRIMAKLEIEKITAQFGGAPDLWRDVVLRYIVVTNGWDLIRICQSNPKYFTGDPQDIFGMRGWTTGEVLGGMKDNIYTCPNLFMGQDDWGNYGLTYTVMDGTYNPGDYGGKGKLNADFSYLYNNNYMNTTKHSINVSAPPSLGVVSTHSYDPSTVMGVICTSDGEADNYVNVNKSFYVLPYYYTAWASDVGINTTSQDRSTKLVLAVKFDDVLYFYPMRLYKLQPNMVYRIKNITLKGEPSEYANLWLKGGQVTKAGEMPGQAGNDGSAGHDVNQWKVHGNVAEIEDLVLYGADAYSEEEGL